MKKLFLFFGLLSIVLSVEAQNSSKTPLSRQDLLNSHSGGQPDRNIAIREIPIWGRQPMKEIGTQQTKLDSTVLRDNLAFSIADVLTYNSSIFVKQYGRATLSTVSFRGTGPSHTQVLWNGMRINNPMLGMTDFSMIPAYFIDDASLLHGTSSVGETGGGLGGAVRLATRPAQADGWGLQYVQGIGMFKTFDEFLRLTWGNDHWQISTRAVYQSSDNDYKYRNRDKKELIYDDNHAIIGSYYPVERNKSGAFADLHLLQEVYYNTGRGDRFGLNAWYIRSNRELALLTTDYADNRKFDNRQREETFRGVLSWDHLRKAWKMSAKAGYIHTWMAYDYERDPGNGIMTSMTRSRSRVNTLFGDISGEYAVGDRWFFNVDVALHQHFVESIDKNIILQEGNRGVVGYDQGRVELDGVLSAKWRPTDRMGLSLVVREQMYGNRWVTVPAFFADYLLSKRGNIVAKASISRNYRFPTLNDLYFLPGGNPDLKNESGFQYEAGLSFSIGTPKSYALSGSVSWYDQHIDDWILWLPTTKGFFSPVNIKKVHAYGVEAQANMEIALSKDWRFEMNGTFSWSPSINEGDPMSPADRSVGKQLPYEPEYSATTTGRLNYRSWGMLWQFCYYSERYTMSSNDISLAGQLPSYFMNNLTLEKGFSFRWADLSLKGSINNLFDEEYLSVLSRPMPGINFEIFIGITPKWGKK